MKGKTKLIILFAIVAVWITHIKAGESADSLTPEDRKSTRLNSSH